MKVFHDEEGGMHVTMNRFLAGYIVAAACLGTWVILTFVTTVFIVGMHTQ